MKNFFVILLCFMSFGKSYAQSCCAQDKGWLAMVSTKDFEAAHLAPEPFNYAPAKGSMIEFNTKDAKVGYAFYVPSDEATNIALIIFHEWWGLNDYIKQEAERWQKMLGNVDVYAVDMYDGKVASTPEEAGKFSKALDAKRGEFIINGLLAQAGKDKEIATLGWCSGGSWAFTATLLAGDQAQGCVIYYGFPEEDAKKIRTLQTDVLFIWGSKDDFITKEKIDTFQSRIEATQHQFTLHTFNAEHAFANPSNPQYEPEATEDAQAIALKFLKEKLRLE